MYPSADHSPKKKETICPNLNCYTGLSVFIIPLNVMKVNRQSTILFNSIAGIHGEVIAAVDVAREPQSEFLQHFAFD